MTVLHTILLLMFVCLLLYAAYCDVRRFEIPNAAPLALLGLFPLFAATSKTEIPMFTTAIVALLILGIGILLFAKGVMGAGDVKLFAAASLWIGPGHCFDFVTDTAAIGGILGLVLLTGIGRKLFDWMRAESAGVTARAWGFKRPMPYGVAISAGALLTLLQPAFLE
ncbi:MAG TPA: prepilin peptidase [Alphaproteobacteria bacterium]|nr:prepilin peptidase [Alphaproteobacteria bacterium]